MSALKKLREKAAMRASSAMGRSSAIGDTSRDFIGAERSSFSGGGARGAVAVKSNLQTLSIDIENTDTVALVAPLFGPVSGLAIPFNGVVDEDGTTSSATKGIVISYKGMVSNKLQLDEIIKSRPFLIQGLRYVHGDSEQLNFDFEMVESIGAKTITDIYQPSIKRNLFQQVATDMDDPEFLLEVKLETLLKVKVKAGHKIKLTFRVDTQYDPSSVMRGESVIVKNGIGHATANPNKMIF